MKDLPENVEQMLVELLGIMDQEIPELGSPSSKEASYARGRNAEKMATANYLRFQMRRLGLVAATPVPPAAGASAEAGV